MIIVGVYEFMRKSERNYLSFNSLVKLQLDEYFEKINTECYLERGLEWYVVEGHYWIELHIAEPVSKNTEGENNDAELSSSVTSSENTEGQYTEEEGEAEIAEYEAELAARKKEPE